VVSLILFGKLLSFGKMRTDVDALTWQQRYQYFLGVRDLIAEVTVFLKCWDNQFWT
jgi:hypothetical protein